MPLPEGYVQPDPLFSLDQVVRRIEHGDPRKATVLEIDHREWDPGDYRYRLAYEEGGEGWWPEHGLEAWKPEFEPDYVPPVSEPE